MGTLTDHLTKTPWPHQDDAFNFLLPKQHGALFADMGTGKSAVAIGLISERRCDVNLIICPVAMVGVWEREIHKFASLPMNPVPLTGPTKKRIQRIEQALNEMPIDHPFMFEQTPEPVVFITNYESIIQTPFFERLRRLPIGVLILDESHRIKTPSSKTTNRITALGRVAKHRLIMTGTPAADKPVDVFSQMRFLDSRILGMHYGPFFERYVEYETRMNSSTGTWYKEILGYKNQEELNHIIYQHAFRVTDEVSNLIEPTDTVIPLEPSPAINRLYRSMLKDSLAEIDNGSVAATNVLTRLLRLQEITAGFLRPDADPGKPRGETQYFDDTKAKGLVSLLEDIGPESVVVFYRFDGDLQAISRVIGHETQRPWFQLNGHRNELDNWKEQDPKDGPVLVVQIRAGSAGVSMVEASKAIYWSHSFSLTDFEQSRKRLHRPGQTRKVSYLHLAITGTIDEIILNALQNKQADVHHLIDELRESV